MALIYGTGISLNDNVVNVPVNLTGGGSNQIVLAAPPTPANGAALTWIRCVGFLLSSQGTGVAVIQDGTGNVLTQISFPGVAFVRPDLNFGMPCTPNNNLQLSCTSAILIVGNIWARYESPIIRSGSLGMPIGLLLALTRP